MTIKALLNAIPEHYELRIWKRDGDTCWEVLDHSEMDDDGRQSTPAMIDYGASELSLLEWVAQA